MLADVAGVDAGNRQWYVDDMREHAAEFSAAGGNSRRLSCV